MRLRGKKGNRWCVMYVGTSWAYRVELRKEDIRVQEKRLEGLMEYDY